ncbi:conserved protein of unknown function (plasmid) [Rhodovastum atsumiense]|uniref:DUF6651 domain-containing protein n=1 Tax=Rhodovastum atsumiense TaxID=504468 RepID=A0A5M6IN34_9PROT|nr:DUF6651 domain-containing protein [Rhodovastum atsumiense]KAA5609664.1 hypothetical protein F1189_23160 [Rhodovastum atsumiense]CAH2606425.1 conserved protein of unknown function [Rhodovastum atsumiense]
MKLKLTADGHAVVQDGKPVYVADDGKEIAFDYTATLATISRLNGEAKGHRERAEAAEGKLKLFEGIEDPEAARKALGTVANLDAKKLIDAGEAERVRTEAIKAVEDKYRPIVKERDGLQAALVDEKIGGAFSRSKFIADRLAIPGDLARAAFGSAFALEDGKIVAKDRAGNRIYSRARPGEVADFDEALESLVDAYPHRDSILKGTGASGSGAAGSGGTGGAGRRTITRAQFDALEPAAKISAAKDCAIVD